MSTRRSKRVYRRRRLTALAVLVALVATVVILVIRLTGPALDFSGAWAGSDALLGSREWHLSHVRGDEYAVVGMSVRGRTVERLFLDGDQLKATGEDSQGDWSVSLELVSGGNQLTAEFRPGGDQEKKTIRLNRLQD